MMRKCHSKAQADKVKFVLFSKKVELIFNFFNNLATFSLIDNIFVYMLKNDGEI